MGNICTLGCCYQNGDFEISEQNIISSMKKEFSYHNNICGIFELNIGISENSPLTDNTLVYIVGESGTVLCCMQYDQFIERLLIIMDDIGKQYTINYINIVNSSHCSHYKWYTLLSQNKHICITVLN